jgi:hypothetical protein
MEHNYLIHWGVKGMRWGVRRSKKSKMFDDAHEDYKRAHSKKSISQMSDQELRERNNRLQMERQYESFNKKTSNGKKFVKAYIAAAGTIAGIAGATATYGKYAKQALTKVGPAVVKKTPQGVKAKAAGVALAYEIAKFRPLELKK